MSAGRKHATGLHISLYYGLELGLETLFSPTVSAVLSWMVRCLVDESFIHPWFYAIASPVSLFTGTVFGSHQNCSRGASFYVKALFSFLFSKP